MEKKNNETVFCSLCGKAESEERPLIKLPGGLSLCPECMQKSIDDSAKNPALSGAFPMNPENFMNFMNSFLNAMPSTGDAEEKEDDVPELPDTE